MTDVSHELGALRFVVDSPLSSKVAMFNNQATQHKQSQLLNPFSHDGRAASPKPTFSKDQYGKPLAGSLTEMRGQKANMHVMKEMLELCQIIDSEGYEVKDEPNMRVIPFGELFNIYNYISDKVVGILLRARKHKLLEFEGEMLYQRRDDDVPIFLLRPIVEIRRELNAKIEEIKRGASPAPQSTSVLLDKSAHEQNLKVMEEQKRQAKSRTPSPAVRSKSKSKSPSPAVLDKSTKAATPAAATSTEASESKVAAPVQMPVAADNPTQIKASVPLVVVAQPAAEEATTAATTEQVKSASGSQPETVPPTSETSEPITQAAPVPAPVTAPVDIPVAVIDAPAPAAPVPVTASAASATVPPVTPEGNANLAEQVVSTLPVNDLPTIVIEASATFVRTISTEQEGEQATNVQSA